MRERMLARAAIAGFAVGVVGLAAVAVTSGDSGDDSPPRLPALSFLGTAAAEDKAVAASYPAGTIEYRVRGTLPDLADRARSWRLGREIEVSRVQTLARGFGLDAPVQAVDDGWTASEGGRALRVERQPGRPWYFSPFAGDSGCVVPPVEPGAQPVAPDTPVSSDGCGSGGSAGATATTSVTAVASAPCPPDAQCIAPDPAPAPIPEPQRPPGLPTREQAEATARATLAKAGIDVGGAAVRVEDAFSQWLVEFDPTIGGLPTVGFATGVSVGPKGVVDAHGWLAQPEEGDDYPLVSATAGLERLKESPYGIGPQPLTAAAARECAEVTGCPEPAPVVRTITGVRLGLAFAPVLAPGDDGQALLVPVFLFDIEDGGTIPVLAVDDEFLPKPVEEPKPGATEPGATEPAPAPTEPSQVGTPSEGGDAVLTIGQVREASYGLDARHGSVGVVRVDTVDGKTVAELRVVGDRQITQTLPSGSYVVSNEQRPCSASCDHLDPPVDRCQAELRVEDNRSVLALVHLRDGHSCSIEFS